MQKGDIMKKIIILSVILLLLSGCSGNLDLKINDNGRITEKISIYEDKLNTHFESEDQFKPYSSKILDTYFSVQEREGYTYENKVSDDKYVLVSKKEHRDKDLCSNIKKSSLKNVVEDLKCTKNGNKYIISGTATYFHLKEPRTEGSDLGDYYDMNDITVTLYLHGKVISNNADSVEHNKYIWNLNNKSDAINIEFELNPLRRILIVGLILVVLVTLASILVIKYKKNRLDY